MASDTVPAAVPGPNDPPHSTAPTAPQGGAQQQPGGLAGLLAPVQPTRSAAFTLTPDQTPATPHDETVAGASSGAFNHTENPDNTGKNTKHGSGGKQERSVVRAWLLAGAERWRKGADARNKALDIKKAKAQARQVKENVTVNRAEKIVGGSTNSNTGNNSNSGKSSNNKTSKKDSGGRSNTGGANKGGTGRGPGGSSGAKNNSGGASGGGRSNGGGGSGGGSGRDGSSGGKGSTDRSSKDRTPTRKQQPSTGDKGSGGEKHSLKKTDSGGKPNSGGGAAGTGKAGPQGPSGKPGKDSPAQKAPKPSKTDTASGKTSTDTTGSDKTSKDGKKPTGSVDRPAGNTKPGKDPDKTDRGPQSANKPGPDKSSDKGTDRNPGEGKHKGKDGAADTKPNTGTGTAPTPRIDLQKSRETGYRDGTRAAKVVAHAHAWRDGARDGYRDTTQAADREKTRLDKAHADRKNARTQAEDQPVTETASSADYQQPVPPKPEHAPGPQPVQVTGTDATHIHLGDHADRSSISRGEVRTLRRFQQRLESKTDRMTQVAEASRTLEHHAKEQLKKVTELLEQARGIEGGEKLVAALTRLGEAAQVQVDKAAEVHKRATRGQEACKTLSANTETRYGGIYQAVVDSPETSPAEMNYYREMSHA